MTDTIRQLFHINSKVVEPGFIGGLEVEVECVENHAVNGTNWSVTEDGSLRNSGREFITKKPANKATLVSDFKKLFESCVALGEEPFSERTSIHVHVNCLELTPAQVRNIIHFYALFENAVFEMVDAARKNNIHCVQLSQTILPEIYRRDLAYHVSAWSKYTALNVLPLQEIGTIEFRHMHGTKDADKLAEWLGMLERLYIYGSNTSMNPKFLSDKRNIQAAYEYIFANTCVSHLSKDETLLQDSLIDLKLAFN